MIDTTGVDIPLPKPRSTGRIPTNDLRAENAALRELLKEGIKIVHCHARNTDKDWLIRARASLTR